MNDLIECGKAAIQWGAMIVTFGLGTMVVGAVIMLLGKILFEKQIEQAFGFVANYINENVR